MPPAASSYLPGPSRASKANRPRASRRRNLVLSFAVIAGIVAMLNGLVSLLLLTDVGELPQRKLFDINVHLGTAIVTLGLGGVLLYMATSAFGGTVSQVLRLRATWPLLVLFPFLLVAGQFQVDHPERLPWLFPIVNVLIVAVPSIVIATTIGRRYLSFNEWAWPLSWREGAGGFIYGAIGATTVAGIINTLYLVFGAVLFIQLAGHGDPWEITDNLPTLPRWLGILFDVSVLSVVAPLNEEFWKGMLVGFFFFRRGGAGRCFFWGVLAGSGFNVLETFQNSLNVVSPEIVSQHQLDSSWWLFACVRVGTGTIHAAATGLSALGFYGLFRRRPRYMLGYPAGVLIHATWNFMAYLIDGDNLFSQAGPDATVLDVLGIAGLVLLFLACLVLLWEMPRRVRDGAPAPIYRILGMVPQRSDGGVMVVSPDGAAVAL